MTLRDHRAVAALPWLLAVSGFTALGYQVIWTRLFAVGLGHELPATYAIIAAFFGGLALGAFLLDRRTALSARPGRWYGALEVGIALWALSHLFPNGDVASLIETGPPDAMRALLDDDEVDAVMRRARALVAEGCFPVDHTGRRWPWPMV